MTEGKEEKEKTLRQMVEEDRERRQREAGERISAVLDELNCRLDFIMVYINGQPSDGRWQVRTND